MEYHIRKSSRTKRLRIAIDADLTVTISAPKNVSESYIHDFYVRMKLWIAKTKEKISVKQSVKIPLRVEKHDMKQYLLPLLHDRVTHYASLYGVSYKKITVRNQKTRWGSCSSRGNLNFNAALFLLPPHLSDYIIVHELCHLLEMNHSSRFWAQVKRVIPDYKVCVQELKNYQIVYQ